MVTALRVVGSASPDVPCAAPAAGPRHAAAASHAIAVHTNGRTTPPWYGNAGPAEIGERSGGYCFFSPSIPSNASTMYGHNFPLGLFFGVFTMRMVMTVSPVSGG